MKKLGIAILGGLLALSMTSCKKDEKKADEDKSGAMAADDMGMPADEMADDMMAADDMGMPADDMGTATGDMGGPAGDMGAPAGDMAAPPAAGVGAELEKILEKQKAQLEAMKTLKTLADLKAKKDEYVKLAVEVFEMQIASLKQAAALPKDQLKAYVEKATKMQADNAQLGKDMIALQAQLMKIKGAKKFLLDTNKELAGKMKPLVEEYTKLQKDVAEKVK
jgi:hypothetical protein